LRCLVIFNSTFSSFYQNPVLQSFSTANVIKKLNHIKYFLQIQYCLVIFHIKLRSAFQNPVRSLFSSVNLVACAKMQLYIYVLAYVQQFSPKSSGIGMFYGVATVRRLLKNTGLFCRISTLL